MATYKVLQDIEAEDKLIGPLTLRQFIYAAIAIVAGFIGFKLMMIYFLLVIPFVPVVVLFAVLAAPFGHDQPNEVWLLAKAKYFIQSHKRIWDQKGLNSQVVITAPKKAELPPIKNFTESEARTRLETLARTIDTRGWAAKNVNINLSNQPQLVHADRIITPETLPQQVSNVDVTPADDIMDAQNNSRAQQFDQMIQNHNDSYKQKVMNNLANGGPIQPKTKSNTVYAKPVSGSSRAKPSTTIKRSSSGAKGSPAKQPPQSDSAILNLALAHNNNWSIATIARQAAMTQNNGDEVVVKLH